MKTPEVWITIGKRGFDDKDLERLVDYQVTGIRINTGRSPLSWAYSAITKLIEVGYKPEQIFLDIGNKKTRVVINRSDKITLHAKDTILISKKNTEQAEATLCDSNFFENILLNDVVYFGDGEIECNVKEITHDFVKLESISEGVITNNISIGIVGQDNNHFNIDAKEVENINQLLEDFPVSLIVSFVETKDDFLLARNFFPNAYEIIPKIETISAVKNFESIALISKTVFIGRGDLGLSVGLEKIGYIQKQLISIAHKLGCRIAIGTGTLDSLKWSQVPLRAEIIDITNYCYEAVDSIVLTSETAGSKEPFKAIDFLEKTLFFLRQQQ